MLIVTNKAASVFNAIEEIAATSSKLEKEAMIKQAGTSSPMFMRVVKAAYDPFITYGLRNVKIPGGMAPGANTLDEPEWWALLDRLAQRTLTGDAARKAVHDALCFLEEPSARLFCRILNKDLRAGFTDGTINRVFKGTIAEFPYMRCTLPEKSNMGAWDWSVGIFSQEKADGMFTNVNHDEHGQVWLTSRQGSPIPLEALNLEEPIKAMLLRGTQSHGELTVIGADGEVLPREVGNGMLNSVLQGGELDTDCRARLDLWDQIPLSVVVPKGKYAKPYKERLVGLITQLREGYKRAPQYQALVALVPTRIVRSKAEAYSHYRDLLKQGKEGTVVKHPDMDWKDSSGGNKDQVKLKLEADVDLRIIQVLPGTPGTKNDGRAGSFQCETSCGTLQVNVTVKNEKLRDEVDKNWDDFAGKIIAVRANSIMPPSENNEFHSLFLPRMIEDFARTDKTEADDLERVREIFQSAVEAV